MTPTLTQDYEVSTTRITRVSDNLLTGYHPFYENESSTRCEILKIRRLRRQSKVMADANLPFLRLPVELRRWVDRHLVFENKSRVEVVSNYIIGNKSNSIRFDTIRDLNLFQASQQTGEESRAVFYNEKHFVLYLYKCIPPYGRQGLYGYRTFHVDFKLF